MFTVNMEKECGCFKKSDFTNNMSFENKDDAMIQAINMTKEMNQEFCQKHEFKVLEKGNSMFIQVADQGQSSCCGGGHCG